MPPNSHHTPPPHHTHTHTDTSPLMWKWIFRYTVRKAIALHCYRIVVEMGITSLYAVFNAGRVFVSWMQNILFWRKMHYCGAILMQKKVPSDPSTSKAAGNNKSIYYVCLLAWNECTKWLSFQTTCLRVVFVFHAISRDWSVHLDVLHKFLCWSIHALFVDFVLLFLFHHKTTTKAKFLFYTKREWQMNLKSMKMGWIRMVKLERSVR